MTQRHQTSATIPRFDEHLSPVALSPATPEEALTHFSIALPLGMADEEGVRAWAKAFVRRHAQAPDWVWALLEPAAPVGELIDRERPFAELRLQPLTLIPKLEEAVAGGHIEVFEAGRYIQELRSRAGLSMGLVHGAQAALDAFISAWVKEEFFRRTHEPRLSADDHPDLDLAFQRFLAAWERYRIWISNPY